MGEIKSHCQTAWASGSKERTKRAGLPGQPWHEDPETKKREEQVWPISTCVDGFEYNVWIIPIKVLPKPIASKTDPKEAKDFLAVLVAPCTGTLARGWRLPRFNKPRSDAAAEFDPSLTLADRLPVALETLFLCEQLLYCSQFVCRSDLHLFITPRICLSF